MDKVLQDEERRAKGSESLTLRVPSDKLEKLREEAERKQVSVNTLANQILTNYIDWDMTAANAGWAVLQRDVLKELFNALDERTLKDIAERTADATRDIRLLMVGYDNLEAFYLILKYRLIKSNFYFSEIKEGEKRRIVIQHDMGKKWSTFFKSHYERMLNGMGYPVKADITENTLILTIHKKGIR